MHDDTIRTDADGAKSSRAIAKAKLLRQCMDAAAVASLKPAAQGILAHLIAHAWWEEDDGHWACIASRQWLANRIGLNPGNVRLYLRHIESAKLVRRRSNKGPDLAKYIIVSPVEGRASAPVEGRASAPVEGRASAPDTSAPARGDWRAGARRTGAPARPLTDRDKFSSSNSSAATAVAEPSRIRVLAAILAMRPLWIPKDARWIDPVTAEELAGLPNLTVDLIALAIERTRQWAKAKNSTCTNPAGAVIRQVREFSAKPPSAGRAADLTFRVLQALPPREDLVSVLSGVKIRATEAAITVVCDTEVQSRLIQDRCPALLAGAVQKVLTLPEAPALVFSVVSPVTTPDDGGTRVEA